MNREQRMKVGIESHDDSPALSRVFENRQVGRGPLENLRQVNGVDALFAEQRRRTPRESLIKQDLHR